MPHLMERRGPRLGMPSSVLTPPDYRVRGAARRGSHLRYGIAPIIPSAPATASSKTTTTASETSAAASSSTIASHAATAATPAIGAIVAAALRATTACCTIAFECAHCAPIHLSWPGGSIPYPVTSRSVRLPCTVIQHTVSRCIPLFRPRR